MQQLDFCGMLEPTIHHWSEEGTGMTDEQHALLARKAVLAQQQELTVREAAEYSDMGVSTLALYAKQGRLQARRVGHMWLINRQSLDTYLRTPHKPGVKKGTKRRTRNAISFGQAMDTQTEDAA